jgi:protease I
MGAMTWLVNAARLAAAIACADRSASAVVCAPTMRAAAALADFDALVLPGGVANPDRLRTEADAIAFASAFFAAGKPVAAICHAPWLLVEADLVRDRTLTSWPSLHTDIANAGGHWVDEQVVVCESGPNVLVTSRKPQDLPAFCQSFTEQFAKTA